MEFHANELKKVCRVCGKKTHKAKGRERLHLVAQHRDAMATVFGINASGDAEDTHPLQFCHSCQTHIRFWKSRGMTAPSHDLNSDPSLGLSALPGSPSWRWKTWKQHTGEAKEKLLKGPHVHHHSHVTTFLLSNSPTTNVISSECPCCSMPLLDHTHPPSKVTMSVLGGQLIKCDRGCNWTVRAIDYQQHLQSQCQKFHQHSTLSPSRTTVRDLLEKGRDTPTTFFNLKSLLSQSH